MPDRYVIGTCPYCKADDQYSDLCEKCGRVPDEIKDPRCSICGQTPIKEKTNHYFFKLKNFWNEADIYHFIGKDIVYHHYLFLPAMRLGINKEFKLPDYIPTRGHLTLESKKISKSRNWYIGCLLYTSPSPRDS